MYHKIIQILVIVALFGSSSAFATHAAQGTGNYKGKRDRHEKSMPQNEKKKKSDGWLHLKK